MFATHSIKKNGRWYKVGEEMDSPAEFMNPPEILEHEEKKITKTDIHRMPVEELRKLATEYGIENSEMMNGSEIKKIILNYLEM